MKRKFIYFTLLISYYILFIGCEGYSCAEGVILDVTDKKLLDSVLCKVITGSEQLYTDSSGTYAVCNNFGGCIPDCLDIVVEFSKTGYKTIRLENPEKDSIYLEKL